MIKGQEEKNNQRKTKGLWEVWNFRNNVQRRIH
jgi:hypothetical protein